MKKCKNCGHSISGKYCSNCGQDTGTERVTKKYILHEIFKLFANVQSGKFYLTKQLFSHPGDAARGFIDGKRKKYYNPIQYYVGTTAITVFLMLNLDTQNITLVNLHETGAYNEMYKSYINAIYRYFNVAEFLLLPILSFFTYIFFKSSGYNYAEMFILNTYLSAQRQLVNLIFILLIYFFPSNSVFINYISLAVLGIFFIWFYIDFFRSQKRSAVIFKSVIILLLFYTCILIILAAIFFLFYFE